MPELNFNLLNPSAELYSGPQVKLDPQAAYEAAQTQQQTNMLSQLYAKHYDPQTGGVNYNSLIGEAAQNPLTARAIPKIMEGAQSQAQSMAEIEQKKAAAAKSEADTKTVYDKQKHDEVNRAIRDISNYANKADALNGIEKSYEAGKIDDAAYGNLMNMVKNEPIWARSQKNILHSLLSEKEQYEVMQADEKAKAPKWEERTDNRQKWYEDINPLSATAGQRRSSVSMQTTPGQAQTAAESDIEPLSHDALVNAAARYNLTGVLPSLGSRTNAASAKTAIINMAALLNKGIDPNDQAMQIISNKANQSALSDITKRETVTGAFEKNFTRNADLVLKYSNKVDRSGVPLFNRWVQAGKRAVTGDADLKTYDLAIKTAMNEYAKIVNNSTSSAATAVSEIKAMNDKLNAADTPEAVNAIISLMKQESDNRMAGFKQQKEELTRSFKPTTPPADNKKETETPKKSLDDIFKKKTP